MRGDNVMGAVTTEINGRPTLNNVKGFLCKTTDDVKKLPKVDTPGTLDIDLDPYINEPCAYGSTATVVTPFSGYILDPSNEWTKVF